MRTMKNVALYARVSTKQGQDPETQLQQLREYASNRGLIVATEYVDRGTSGAKDSRPKLDALMKDARTGKFDGVLVWKFDRFARSVSHLLRGLETFQALGVEFVSLTEGVDTSTPAGKLVFTVLGAVAELERSVIAERVRAGLRNARAKGKKLGRPGKTVNVGEIAALRAAGKSWRAISNQTGISTRSARRALIQRGKTAEKDFCRAAIQSA